MRSPSTSGTSLDAWRVGGPYSVDGGEGAAVAKALALHGARAPPVTQGMFDPSRDRVAAAGAGALE